VGGTGYTAARKIAGSGPGTAQGSAEAVAAAVPGLGVPPLTQAMSYVVKGRQRRDGWGAEIWTSDRQRSLTPRKLALLLHKVIAAYATEHQTRMQCVAELPRASLLSPSKGAYSAQSLRPEKAA
jgi:hypothetical protein